VEARLEGLFADWLYSMECPAAFDLSAMDDKWRRAHRALTLEYAQYRQSRERHRTKQLERMSRKAF